MAMLPSPNSDGWTKEVNLQPLIFNLALDASTEFFFGKSVDSQKGESEFANFGKHFDIASASIRKRSQFSPYSGWISTPAWNKSINMCHNLLDTMIGDTLKVQEKGAQGGDSNDRYIFLKALAAETHDTLELRSQLMHILLAGRDTTSSLVSWTLFALVRDPNRFIKLREAIIQDFGIYEDCDVAEDVTFEKLKACKYLQYCMNETLRLYTPVPWNVRVSNKDTTLPRGGGPDGKSRVYVPKGTQIEYSLHVLHHRADIWGGDAEEYKPERWEGKKTGWEYLPVRCLLFLSVLHLLTITKFNGGPRICLGQQYALTEAAFVLVRLLQRFDQMENMDPEEAKHFTAATGSSANGVKVKLHYA